MDLKALFEFTLSIKVNDSCLFSAAKCITIISKHLHVFLGGGFCVALNGLEGHNGNDFMSLVFNI